MPAENNTEKPVITYLHMKTKAIRPNYDREDEAYYAHVKYSKDGKSVVDTEDYLFDEDSETESLYLILGGVMQPDPILTGDWYHMKISVRIEAYLKGVKDILALEGKDVGVETVTNVEVEGKFYSIVNLDGTPYVG